MGCACVCGNCKLGSNPHGCLLQGCTGIALIGIFKLYKHVRGESNERKDSDIVSHADDEDEPESEGEVFDVFEADLLPRPILLPLEDPLRSTIKHTQQYGTEQ